MNHIRIPESYEIKMENSLGTLIIEKNYLKFDRNSIFINLIKLFGTPFVSINNNNTEVREKIYYKQ